MTAVKMTRAQIKAIAEQTAIYGSVRDGYNVPGLAQPIEVEQYDDDGSVIVSFWYENRDIPTDVYVGLEQAVFAPSGEITDAQDFG